MKFKYIIFEDDSFVIFGDFLTHEQMKDSRGGLKPVSAGMCFFTSDGRVNVMGESISLKLKSRLEDYNLINGFKDM